MYKDNLEAARARIAALEAEVEAEQQRRKAAEADTRAIRASLHEFQLASKRECEREQPDAPAPRKRRGGLIALVIVVSVLGVLAVLMVGGAVFYLTARTMPPMQAEPVQAKPVPPHPLFPPMAVDPAVPEPPPEKPADPQSWVVDPFDKGTKRQVRPSELLALQRRHKGALKTCYQHALARDPSFNLVLQLTVVIGESGVVKEVKVQPSSPLSRCVVRSVRRWVFPAVGEQTLDFPIIFRGSS
jgi:hypothetical protein